MYCTRWNLFSNQIENNNYLLVKWLEGKGSPEIITENDAPNLLEVNDFFVKKINTVETAIIIDQLLLL